MNNTESLMTEIPRFIVSGRKYRGLNTDAETYPSIYIESADHVGIQKSITELCDRIHSHKMIGFHGLQTYADVRLRFGPDFRAEFQKVRSSLKAMAGYHNRFEGVVAVDLTDWKDHWGSQELMAFLDYLRDTNEGRIYIFYTHENRCGNLRRVIEKKFILEYVNPEPTRMYLLHYAQHCLQNQYGIELPDETSIAFYSEICRLQSQKSYRGLETMQNFCMELGQWMYTENCRKLNPAVLQRYKQKNLDAYTGAEGSVPEFKEAI